MNSNVSVPAGSLEPTPRGPCRCWWQVYGGKATEIPVGERRYRVLRIYKNLSTKVIEILQPMSVDVNTEALVNANMQVLS